MLGLPWHDIRLGSLVNDKEAQTLVSMLVGGYPGVRFNDENRLIYVGAIQGFDARETQSAIETLIKTAPHFPKPAEITAEVMSQRREKTRLEENARAAAATRRPSSLQMPSKFEWGAVLPRMLEADARHRRLMKDHRRRRGLEPRVEEDCVYLDIVQRGAAGELTESDLGGAFKGFGLGGLR